MLIAACPFFQVVNPIAAVPNSTAAAAANVDELIVERANISHMDPANGSSSAAARMLRFLVVTKDMTTFRKGAGVKN
jgi:hypothetical protein